MRDRSGASPTKHSPDAPTPPNPAAAALYTQAAADYENAARDADRLGAHTRADTHRQRAAEQRAHAAGYSPTAQDDDPNGPWLPKIPGPRKPGVTASDVCLSHDPDMGEALRRVRATKPRTLAGAR